MVDYDTGTYETGDARIPYVDVAPNDITTTVVLSLIDPDDIVTTPSSTKSGDRWTADNSYILNQPGEWIERWAITGTGIGNQERVIFVAPLVNDLPSGARVYATTADYARALGASPPKRSRRALWEASRAIDDLLLTSFYDTDVDGMPTDAEVIIAMRDATCAQAEYAKAIGDQFGVGAGQYHSVSLGPATLTRAYGPGGSKAPGRFSAKAFDILQAAGLTGHDINNQ